MDRQHKGKCQAHKIQGIFHYKNEDRHFLSYSVSAIKTTNSERIFKPWSLWNPCVPYTKKNEVIFDACNLLMILVIMFTNRHNLYDFR